MIDFSQAVQAISDNGGFKSNAQDTSFYRVYTTQGSKPIQVRVSNHGTHLWTWYDRNYNPSASINICIVLSQNGENNTNTSVDMRIKDEQGKVIGERKPFEVTQYVYNCQELNNNDAALINQAVLNIWRNGSFTDPLVNTPKKALVQRLQPTPKQNTENNQKTNENKIMNKKQVIRLNESQLKQIVTESVKRVLKETAGHLYYKDDEGNPHTNSKELYRGVKGAIFVYHGDWADPEILYKNHSINYWDAEQSLWYNYKEYCEENNIKPTDDGFEKYVNEYEDVASTLDELVWALDGNP